MMDFTLRDFTRKGFSWNGQHLLDLRSRWTSLERALTGVDLAPGGLKMVDFTLRDFTRKGFNWNGQHWVDLRWWTSLERAFVGVDLTCGGFTPECVLVSSVCLKFKMRERGQDGLNQSGVDLIDTDASGSRS